MNKNEEIIQLYRQLKPKGDFIKAASKKFGVVPGTVRYHWIIGENIPAQYHDEVKKLLQHILEEQRKYAKNIGL